MSDISVSFVHPTDGRVISVTLDGSMTAQEAIGELVGAEFIMPIEQGYNLAIKGGDRLRNDQSLADGGAKNGTTLRVLPATNAG